MTHPLIRSVKSRKAVLAALLGLFAPGLTTFAQTSSTFTTLLSFVPGANGRVRPAGGTCASQRRQFLRHDRSGISTPGAARFSRLPPPELYTHLYTFDGMASSGASPEGSLIQGVDGKLYGETLNNSGELFDGTIFSITLAGSETTVYTFPAGIVLGSNSPVGGLVEDGAGNFYGTAPGGGANNTGTIFQFTSTGTLNTLLQFQRGEQRKQRRRGPIPPRSCCLGADGSLYGTANEGGTNGTGTIFVLAPLGEFLAASYLQRDV